MCVCALLVYLSGKERIISGNIVGKGRGAAKVERTSKKKVREGMRLADARPLFGRHTEQKPCCLVFINQGTSSFCILLGRGDGGSILIPTCPASFCTWPVRCPGTALGNVGRVPFHLFDG